jgi:hypothetical protein
VAIHTSSSPDSAPTASASKRATAAPALLHRPTRPGRSIRTSASPREPPTRRRRSWPSSPSRSLYFIHQSFRGQRKYLLSDEHYCLLLDVVTSDIDSIAELTRQRQLDSRQQQCLYHTMGDNAG